MSSSVLKKLLLVVLVAGAAQVARAQFVVDGTEKTGVSWKQLRTEDYRFVYPAPFDSLARTYALEWERWKLPVSYSIGREPNGAYRRRMPVILHPYLGYSNGMVVWTPRRMEMYTGPEMVSPWPVPWHTVLAIHEQRHVAQMQFLRERPIRWSNYVFGEALAGFWSIWYFDPSHFEGDAVTIETALTTSGRGRSADFLEYYRASFDQGQLRNYERWRYGSQRLYTPNYYTVGYLAIGGMRAVYDKPLFMKDYNDWKIPYRKQVRRQTGMKLKKSFAGVMAVQDSLWRTDDSLRALERPFQPMEQVTQTGRYYASYSGLTFADGSLFARRTGIADDHMIVRIDPSESLVRELCYTGADSPLSAFGPRLYWSETLYDPRWEMHSDSGIRYLEDGKIKTLVRGGRYFNPKAFEGRVLACKTNYDGSTLVVELDPDSGLELDSWRAPDGLMPFEAVAIGPEIFCAAVSDAGEGIYRLPSFEPVLEPLPVSINHLYVREDKLFFTSDRTGVNELYTLSGGGVEQYTNLKAGGKDFVFGDDGYLYFTGLKADGRMVYRTPVDSLPVRHVDFSELHKYELADKLSEQEAALASQFEAPAEEPVIGEPKRYSRLGHAIKVHSWMPFYVDYDELSNVSGENLYVPAGLGATAFFQNDLNTLYGYAAYGFNPGVMQDDNLPLHTGLVDIKYRGLYPVFEAKFGINRLDYLASLKTYVPINLSSDGWTRAIVPGVTVASSRLSGTVASAELRAYSLLPTLNSCYFPHLGIGWSIGVSKDFDFENPLPYATLYGYLPGLWKTSGLGISANYSAQAFTNETITKAAGITLNTTEVKVNYAIPFLSVDWNGLSPLAYIRNFEFIPKGSFSNYTLTWDPARITPSGGPTSFNIWTAGAAFDVVLGNIWFIPYNFRVGVSASYVWGNPDPTAKPYEIKFVFNTDLL
ncbi:MAG: hypothetical protein J6X39_00245 [Bacteroidales bacterium]|nr:hypothetical protein [Bacteroidales bacterium]